VGDHQFNDDGVKKEAQKFLETTRKIYMRLGKELKHPDIGLGIVDSSCRKETSSGVQHQIKL